MPSTRAIAALAAGLVAVGALLLVIGGALLVFARAGAISAGGMVALFTGLGGVVGGVYLLTRGRVAQTRAHTVVPGMPQLRRSTSPLPGLALVFTALVLVVVGVRGAATWSFVLAAIAGLAGMVLFALSGSPDEPA